jgi:hypothetical protein
MRDGLLQRICKLKFKWSKFGCMTSIKSNFYLDFKEEQFKLSKDKPEQSKL